ncbi:MAG: nucleoside monophosphate kinase [Phycisphaerae bacterium]
MTPPAAEQHGGGDRPDAVLLVGPTGAGKTPLGDALAAGGLWGRPCAHFDFGRTLRACVRGEGGAGVTPEERAVFRRMLETDALLADEHFPVAERLFRAFVAAQAPDAHTLIVLNGLPRHVGQAERMAHLVRMRAVVHLKCSEEAVRARVRRDTGGDRGDRDDDAPARLRRKLAVYREQTEPLLAYYRERGAAILPLQVGAETTADAMRAELERRQGAT